ncbi:hypothetical protein [Amycolatopsis jejuensis]|uniref:hypothetical protein n=1 Tax=Amycolatopsis jejuensis TaxID=330084 RepID=UPI0005276506|nr:hypothetical protein [Amycolatopsis jejuensis]
MADEPRELAHFHSESGQVIGMDLPLDEHMQDKVTKGYLRRVNPDGSPWQEPVDDTEDTGSELTNGVPPRPAVNAAKAEWVGYAVNALGMDPNDAEAATKQDLIDLAK